MSLKRKELEIVTCDQATPAGGHYSHAVIHGDLIFISGQLGFDPGTTKINAKNFEEEMQNCLANMAAILSKAGSSVDRLLKVTIYLSDVKYWTSANKVYAEFLGTHKPARAVIPCNTLHHGFKVEIEAIAAIK